MEKEWVDNKVKVKWVNKLKNKNACELHSLLMQGFIEMQLEIKEMYKQIENKWYDKELKDIEKNEISDFLDVKIEKGDISDEKTDEYVEKYKKLKELIDNKLYIKVAELKVMRENFRVDSTDWEEIVSQDWKKVKVNTNRDIWEYIDGELEGEQLFTREAAKREIDKEKWIKMLELEDWNNIIIECRWEIYGWGWRKNWNIVEKIGMKFSGYRINSNDGYGSIGLELNYWLPQYGGARAKNVWFRENAWNHCRFKKSCGFSVRCLKR